jgi:hypothetical protein
MGIFWSSPEIPVSERSSLEIPAGERRESEPQPAPESWEPERSALEDTFQPYHYSSCELASPSTQIRLLEILQHPRLQRSGGKWPIECKLVTRYLEAEGPPFIGSDSCKMILRVPS